jgi:hypothetical protein
MKTGEKNGRENKMKNGRENWKEKEDPDKK